MEAIIQKNRANNEKIDIQLLLRTYDTLYKQVP